MNQNGLAADVVEWIDKLPPAQLSSPPVSVAVADAYATAKNWSRLKRFTRTGNWGNADYLRLAFQAIAVQHLRSGSGPSATSEFSKSWQSAYELSQNDSQRQLTLARLATKWQLESQAEQLWLAIEKDPSMRREALDNLRRIYRAGNETAKLYEVLERLHEISPDEAPITADLARLGLNLEQNVAHSHQLAKEAYDRAPNEINCAVTYAFSLCRLGRNAEALAIIQTLSPDQLHDPHAAVCAALILIEAGQIDAAKEVHRRRRKRHNLSGRKKAARRSENQSYRRETKSGSGPAGAASLKRSATDRALRRARATSVLSKTYTPSRCSDQLCFPMASVQSEMSCLFMWTRSSKRASRNPPLLYVHRNPTQSRRFWMRLV